MATLNEIQAEFNLSDDEIVQLAVEQLNMSAGRAAFVLLMERGEITGDVVVVDDEDGE